MTSELTFHPVTPDRWPDLETLFGERGAYAGCWCMWWRMPRADFDKQPRSERREALKSIVDSERVPGLLAYRTSDRQTCAEDGEVRQSEGVRHL